MSIDVAALLATPPQASYRIHVTCLIMYEWIMMYNFNVDAVVDVDVSQKISVGRQDNQWQE